MSSVKSRGVELAVNELAVRFGELADPRSSVNLRHPLVGVLMAAVMAVMAGAEGPTSIARWARMKKNFLLDYLDLPHGIPSRDVFRRVLMAVKPLAFQACFQGWLDSLQRSAATATGIDQPVVAIDGKTLRRTHDHSKGLHALHCVTAWASDYGLCLGQVATDQKSNEITAIPELLRLIHLEGAIVTIDAMGTQTAIAEQIIDEKADYVLALKGNQESIHQAVVDYVEEHRENDFADVKVREHTTAETGHGRQETRVYLQLPAPKTLPGFERWVGLKTIGVVILLSLRNGKETLETRYFLSSLPLGVKRFAHAVRSHWGIENACHWCLDVTYREDSLRLRQENLRENFAWLNRFSLSLLKQHPDRKLSIAMKRRSCAWNDDFLIQVLTGICT